MSKNVEHLIWTSEVDYEDWRAELEETMPEATEDQRRAVM